MIVASRTPALTGRMKPATLRAARERQGASGMEPAARTPERRLLKRLGLFGYHYLVTRDRRAA
jgi:hypothetical protein